MPQTDVLFYMDDDGSVPVLAWLEELLEREPKVFAKVRAKIALLEQLGHELRRPAADYLEDGIYELRTASQNVNYRVLYFFHGQNVAILAHGMTKEKKIPQADLERARARKNSFEGEPAAHTYEEEE